MSVSLRDIVQLSPVPVSFVGKERMTADKFSNVVTFGRYYFGRYSKTKNERVPYIEIFDGLGYYKKIGTLLHEIGHAKCDKEKCECWKSDKMAEIHAYSYTLKWLLKYKLRKSLEYEIIHLKRNSDRDDYHGEAIREVMKSELYRECVNYTF